MHYYSFLGISIDTYDLVWYQGKYFRVNIKRNITRGVKAQQCLTYSRHSKACVEPEIEVSVHFDMCKMK
jgi:hypothetical protein